MRKYDPSNPGVGLDLQADKFEVTVTLSVRSESADDAWEYVRNFLVESVENSNEEEEREVIYDYNIISSEPSELNLDEDNS